MDLSFTEIIAVCLIALLVFGPEDFVRKMSKIGSWIGRLKNQAQHFRHLLEQEIHQKDTPKISNEESNSKDESS